MPQQAWPTKKLGDWKLLATVLIIVAIFEIFIIKALLLGYFTLEQLYPVFWSLMGGILAGFVVYIVLEIKDKKHWEGSKAKLLENFDSILIGTLSTVRLAAGISPPKNINNSTEVVSFLKDSFGYNSKFQNLKDGLSGMDEKRKQIFLSNVRNIQESIRFILPLFISFRKADSWYVERIFELNEKLHRASVLYMTFPEISQDTSNNDRRLNGFKEQAVTNIIQLTDSAFSFRENLSKRK